MMQLTDAASHTVDDIARRYNLSRDAVLHMLDAVQRGNGTMAQFNHQELGGSGQWMQGGMTMVGDMFNNQLKFTVENLCMELNNLLSTQPFIPPPQGQAQGQWGGGNWWPAELGQPASSGAQNNIRYAYFPGPCRLAIEMNGVLKLYDTGNHQIQGVSQQQGGGYNLSFNSQFGTVSVADLPEVGQQAPMPPPPSPEPPLPMESQFAEPRPVDESPPPAMPFQPMADNPPPTGSGSNEMAILATLEKLAELHQRGILSEAEFTSKKAELLSRL